MDNIINGITGDFSVNVHQAVLVGEAILEKMYGVDAPEFIFSKKDFAVVLDQKQQFDNDGAKCSNRFPTAFPATTDNQKRSHC